MNNNEEGADRYSDWEEDEEVAVQDLFSNQSFRNVLELLQYNNEVYNFDLADIIKTLQANEIDIIMLINYIRYAVQDCSECTTEFIQDIKLKILNKEFNTSEKYMHPALSDDPLLFLLGETVLQFDENGDGEADNEKWDNDRSKYEFFDKVKADNIKPTINATQAEQIKIEMETPLQTSTELTGDYYFDGYSHIGIHETMLRDASRTNAYAMAIERNKEYIKDKVVLDVGCGTGILCLFAARAGARKVVGVDCSSILKRSRQVVKRNGFDDVITLVQGRLEEVELPLEYGEVDVIVSEWMGYGLYFENMLPAVMYAREKYLKGIAQPDGSESKQSPDLTVPVPTYAIMPSHAQLFMEAASCVDSEDRVKWWNDVYGFNMVDMCDLFTHEAQVDLVHQSTVVSERLNVHELEMIRASTADLDFTVPFELKITKECLVNVFVISFDVLFMSQSFTQSNETTVLSTGVADTPTHWKQAVLWLTDSNSFAASAGDVVKGQLQYIRMESNDRDYEIAVTFETPCSPVRQIYQRFILVA